MLIGFPTEKKLLTVELVPKGQWGTNLRSELPKKEWDRLRKDCYAKADYCCEICNGKGHRHPVECHEIWHYDEETKTQRLDGLIALCPPCHQVKHIGRTMAIGKGEKAIKHIMKVNGWSKQDVELYLEEVFETWSRRSQEKWTLDISWLDK